ncbi:hypothetical protein F4778DRAFT_785007 [Xylariomycetidae sp. FL2044]|nr:hypothetical protein F4778DRAFT_785007 [Xylariomycetidae sp. FL2044]
MSLMLSSAGRLKPEIRLAQAINDFVNVLSKEQEAAFEAGRNICLASPPSLQDVMQVTAELDRKARLIKGDGHRCFGPRMTKALETVQRFASIGDVIIGGSQNLIACGVWSLFRLSLFTVVRFTSLLEKLSSLLMAVGQSAPRYQQMVALHQRSRALQNSWTDYFIVIVRLCQQLMAFCNQSAMGKLKIFATDLDVTAFEGELLEKSKAIREQLTIEEARANSAAREALSRLSSAEKRRMNLERRDALLNACSTFGYQVAWKQARKSGTATWFSNDPDYIGWRDINSGSSSTMLLSGKLGSGKSVALASIVDDLHMIADHKDLENRRIWANQKAKFDTEDLLGGLSDRELKSTVIYIVLDGIDECSFDARSPLIKFLKHLQTWLHVKLCISYRSEADARVRDELRALGPDVYLEMPESNPDIAAFIHTELELGLESGKLTLGDPTLVIEIAQALEDGAQGMFLWTVLQIESICTQKTDIAIRAALADLPKDLNETFVRVLEKARAAAPDYQTRLFMLLIAAVRPLKADELREALSVVHGDTVWNPSRQINNIHAILAAGGSLLTVNEEELTVHLIHPSVEQFLVGGLGINGSFHIGYSRAEMEMCQTILTYLNYNVFDTQLSTYAAPSIPGNRVYGSLISTIRRADVELQSDAVIGEYLEIYTVISIFAFANCIFLECGRG